MPHTKSAAKRLKTSGKARLRHNTRRRKLKILEKKYRTLDGSRENKNEKEILSELYAQLDKAAKAGTIHPNKASRKKSQLAKILAKKGKS